MEYELAFFNFDYKTIVNKLKKLGGKKLHKFALYNVAYFYLAGEQDFSKGFIRIRDENGNVKLTTKLLDKSKYAEEYEIGIDGTYDNIKKILEKGNLECKIESVKYRDKWSLVDTHEIVFDIWPGLPISLEIDCDSEKKLNNTCKKLDLNIKDGFTGSQYNKLYEITNDQMKKLPNINFNNFRKILKPHITKNNKIFNTLTKQYYGQFI